MSDLHWKTAISKVEPNSISLRGYSVDRLMGKTSFAQAVYLALKGEMPTRQQGLLLDAVLVSSIDHGAGPPSVLAARTAASTGAPMNAAVAAGVLAINRFHGGAIEEAMILFRNVVRKKKEEGGDLRKAAEEVLRELKDSGQRASGFGHRVHSRDPRTVRLFDLADELKISGKYVAAARAVEQVLAESAGKTLPINVDGAIAALLCEMDIPPEIGNAFFIIPRVAGLVAHVREEQTRMRPMRKIHPEDHEYDGPDEKEIP